MEVTCDLMKYAGPLCRTAFSINLIIIICKKYREQRQSSFINADKISCYKCLIMIETTFYGDYGEESSRSLPVEWSNIHDQALERAYTDSILQGTVTPLLKRELHLKIQCKRLSEGKQELEIQEERPPKNYALSEEEILKRNKRLDQNKASAVRSRVRFRQREEELMREVNTLEQTRRTLVRMRDKLKKDISELQTSLLNHVNECKNEHLKCQAELRLRSITFHSNTMQPSCS
ncbi:hypothetical protein ACJMK2_035391 [Sinanodonta woodiana]|uniref:BZIP domain-containing protein n=1 Tax=Sinanodonta woodiana TaxID=1069815 RepID=A0ABD3WUT2_SINWO